MQANQLARQVCLKLGFAREQLRMLGYMEGVNKEYTDKISREIDRIQRDLESQLR